MNNDVVIGNWRAGLNKTMAADLEIVEKRYNAGFRQLPYESTVMELALILDAYDAQLDEDENRIVSETHSTNGEGVSLTIQEEPVKKARKKS